MIDFGALVYQLSSRCWWLLSLFIVAAFFKSARFTGLIGIVMVNMTARLFLGDNVNSNSSITDMPDIVSLPTVFVAFASHPCS